MTVVRFAGGFLLSWPPLGRNNGRTGRNFGRRKFRFGLGRRSVWGGRSNFCGPAKEGCPVPLDAPAPSDEVTVVDLTGRWERPIRRPGHRTHRPDEERFVVEWQADENPSSHEARDNGFTASVGISVLSG